jgi:hypothetical protein
MDSTVGNEGNTEFLGRLKGTNKFGDIDRDVKKLFK